VLPTLAGVAPITAKRDVIHKTGNTQCSATPPQEGRATATWNVHKKFPEDRSSGSRDMLADRQTHRHTDGLITIQYSAPYRGRVINKGLWCYHWTTASQLSTT